METMNSSQESRSNDEIASCADTNANLNDTSRGAIPKKPKISKKSSIKKSAKLNNNIENMSTLNIDEAQKMNGITNGLPSCYLEEFIEPSCSSHKSCFHESKDECNSSDETEEASFCSAETEVLSVSEASIGSAETEVLSVSEDGCIYTFKGDQVADLPVSFFELPPDIPENRENEVSSPEMDYLEMDFDPSNNGDVDSSSDSDANDVNPLDSSNVLKNSAEPEVNGVCNEIAESTPSTSSQTNNLPVEPEVLVASNCCESKNDQNFVVTSSQSENAPSTSNNLVTNGVHRSAQLISDKEEETTCEEPMAENMPWSCSLENRTMTHQFRVTKRLHMNKGELVSPTHNVPQINGANVHQQPEIIETFPSPQSESQNSDSDNFDSDSAMIWTPEEAASKQFTQMGPSSCGASAVLNVLKVLRPSALEGRKPGEFVDIKYRKNEAPLTEYLLSRSVAGSTHEELIEGLHRATDGAVYARFFHFYPERVVNLCTWLRFWIGRGAVPIATLNLQQCSGTVPDAWHHQMIYGVDASGVYLTNPLERVDADLLWPQLRSESVLLVRRIDVLSRWNINADLPELMKINDARWQRINVVGQVANMVLESGRPLRPGFTNTSHIRIPAAYSSGITLAVAVNSPACQMLKQSPELPLLYPHDAASTTCANH